MFNLFKSNKRRKSRQLPSGVFTTHSIYQSHVFIDIDVGRCQMSMMENFTTIVKKRFANFVSIISS